MIGNVIWLAIYLINVHQRRETLNICWLLFVYLFVCYYLMILCLVSQCDQYHVSQSVASEEYIGCHFFYFYFYFLHNTVCCLWRNIKQGERLFSDFVHWFHLQSQSLTTRLPVREVLCRLCFQPDSTASTCSFVCVEEVKKKKKTALNWLFSSNNKPYSVQKWGILLFESQQSANGNRCIHQRLMWSITSSNNEVLQSIILQ